MARATTQRHMYRARECRFTAAEAEAPSPPPDIPVAYRPRFTVCPRAQRRNMTEKHHVIPQQPSGRWQRPEKGTIERKERSQREVGRCWGTAPARILCRPPQDIFSTAGRGTVMSACRRRRPPRRHAFQRYFRKQTSYWLHAGAGLRPPCHSFALFILLEGEIAYTHACRPEKQKESNRVASM